MSVQATSVPILEVGQDDFDREVIDASRSVPVLVDFWAPWCGPCRALGPILEKLAEDYAGRFRLVKVNSDENPQLSLDYGIRSIPAVKAFVDGELVDEFLGALPESAIRAFIDRLLPGPAEVKRREARHRFEAGDAGDALALLDAALALEPRNDHVKVDRAEALYALGRGEEAVKAIADLSPLAALDTKLAPTIARIRLALAAPDDADEPALIARIATNPADLDARLELATLCIAEGRHEPALEQLIEIIRTDRKFGDDVGRRTMLQLFDVLGGDNALVVKYRRQLASALN
ncbi:MAG: co-chaperone YbbN [Betaproteobacteria bacterium]